jgi:hypothetical protein
MKVYSHFFAKLKEIADGLFWSLATLVSSILWQREQELVSCKGLVI